MRRMPWLCCAGTLPRPTATTRRRSAASPARPDSPDSPQSRPHQARHAAGDIGVRALAATRPTFRRSGVCVARVPPRVIGKAPGMNLLFRIVYAAHASGTHHKLALDALRHLRCVDADLWQRLFLTARQALPGGLQGARQRVQGLQEPRAAHPRRLLGRGAREGAQLVQPPRRGAGAAGLADGRLLRRRAQPLLHRPAASLPHRPVGGREQHPPRGGMEHLQGL